MLDRFDCLTRSCVSNGRLVKGSKTIAQVILNYVSDGDMIA